MFMLFPGQKSGAQEVPSKCSLNDSTHFRPLFVLLSGVQSHQSWERDKRKLWQILSFYMSV